MLTIFYTVLFYAASGVLVIGLVRKIRCYAITPAPLKIPTTPAPTTAAGVRWRMAREVVLFESLFKSSKWTWIFGWAFHVTLLLVVLRHLRYFQEPVWLPVVLIQPFGTYAGFAMLAALAGLWARRWLVDRVRYISTPSDHLMLVALLMSIFPISKLLHAPGLFFSPTRNQADNAREVRHISAWAAALDKKA